MSNEELAVLIQTGKRERLGELWAGVERFVWQQANRRAYALDGYGGVTAEDLYQSGYFALLAAVDTYDPTAGMTFIGWLALYLKTAFAETAGYRTQKRWADPLQQARSLDAPLSNDTEDISLADSIPDSAADAALDAVIEQDRRQRLLAALEAAIAALPEMERYVLRARCYQGRTLEDVAAERSISRERVRQIEAGALRILRHPMNNRELRKHL